MQPHSIDLPHKLWRPLWDAGVIEWWERGRLGEQFALLMNESLYGQDAALSMAGYDDLGLMIE